MVTVDDFKIEKECINKGVKYAVHENGLQLKSKGFDITTIKLKDF